MKKIYYLMAAALFVAASCEKSPAGQEISDEGNVYMQFSVKMLSTRSQTDATGGSNSNATPDIEVGLDKENTISSVDIVLVGGNTVKATNVTPVAADGTTYVAKFDNKSLVAGSTYKVYIYANCSAPATINLDEVSEATIASMTQDNKFWMTNAYAAKEVTLPASLAPYTTPQTPLSLEAHEVERSMARFDYKPSSAFNMGAGLTLTLTEAALINQSKEHYMFRRVTEGSTATSTNAIVGGVETPSNWVVDTDWSNKIAANFDAPLGDPTKWGWTSLASLTTNDNYDGDYKIWCYAKENTIPGIEAQKHDVSTGVVFKAQITAGDGASDNVKAGLASGKRIYVFNNTLYGTWDAVKAAATANGAEATLAAAYNQAIVGMAEGADDPVSATAAKAGFTGYSATKNATDNTYSYYAYYYYWNRHNDNLNNNTMGIMEFAVVRNNVYKLAVNAISRFGHPTPPTPTDPNPDPDPDPVDPDDPDESVNYYFNVTVKVLPWTVRIN
ncbi:MAG: Mfa1 family fimbria major subunit, partial [Candidatus Cryptobacteroides sp.]